MTRVKELIKVYIFISAVIGAPLLAVTLLMGVQRTVATVTCEVLNQHCASSWGAKAIEHVQY